MMDHKIGIYLVLTDCAKEFSKAVVWIFTSIKKIIGVLVASYSIQHVVLSLFNFNSSVYVCSFGLLCAY